MERNRSPTPDYVLEAREKYMEIVSAGIDKNTDRRIAALQAEYEHGKHQREQVVQEAEERARKLRQQADEEDLRQQQELEAKIAEVRTTGEKEVHKSALNFSQGGGSVLGQHRSSHKTAVVDAAENEAPVSSSSSALNVVDHSTYGSAIAGSDSNDDSTRVTAPSAGASSRTASRDTIRGRSRSPKISLASASSLRSRSGADHDPPARGVTQQVEKYSDERLKNKQKEWLRGVLRTLKKHPSTQNFLTPVDWKAQKIPDYPDVILKEKRMDLSTIENRLENNQYRSLQTFAKDINTIVDVTRKYNGDEHKVTRAAFSMLEAFRDGMKKCPK